MVVPATFSDIPGVLDVMQRAHKRSIYADTATFDELAAKQLLLHSINRHGHTNLGGSLCFVSKQEDGAIAGFIIGYIDVVYPGLKEKMASDLLFICDEDAPAQDAGEMLRALLHWGRSAKGVIEIVLGVSGAIGDPERTGKLYERAGLTRCGTMYRMEVQQ